jgi:large subunit ribosomal protein L25
MKEFKMASEVKISGVSRNEFGKGASRRARREGLVPAVIYGHGEVPQHVALPAKEVNAALKASNVLIEVSVDGKSILTLPKAVSRHPLQGTLAHIDLLLVRRGEKVEVEVPVHTEGEHDRDGILEHVNNTITVLAEATSIPNFLVLNIQGLKAGESKRASDVTLPAGVVLAGDPDQTVVHLGEKSTSSSSDEAAAETTPAATAN